MYTTKFKSIFRYELIELTFSPTTFFAGQINGELRFKFRIYEGACSFSIFNTFIRTNWLVQSSNLQNSEKFCA